MKVLSSSLLSLILSSSLTTSIQAFSFDDFVDPTYNCPAQVTCPVICVADVTTCPTFCDENETLCNDGSCSTLCDPTLESPCEADCASLACPKVVDFRNICQDLYGDFYQAEEDCAAEEEAAANLRSFNEPAYIFAYTWVSVTTFLIIAWCFFNQKLVPVEGSHKPLNVAKELAQGTSCIQDAYHDKHPVGMFLHFLALATFAGWNVLLCWLTIQYYALDESPYVAKRKVLFEDEENLLKTYIIVWSMGFTWCFLLLKWPYKIRALFYRRCTFKNANLVAVFLELPPSVGGTQKEGSAFGMVRKCFHSVSFLIESFMGILFSDKYRYHSRSGVYKYCPVRTDSQGVRYFVFLFRRYNYDEDTDSFVPGIFSVGEKLGDYVAAGKNGLSQSEVDTRTSIVGPNVIEMDKPVFLRVLIKELSKPFYTYQLFMIWSWMPLYYYYMALVWSVVISTSVFVVAFFSYRNLRNLYGITHMEDVTVKVLRGGEYVEDKYRNLVPGDVIQLVPGIAYCDMLIIAGQATLIDESALTGEASPQAKAPIDPVNGDKDYDKVAHKRHTIWAGTRIQESEDGVAVVMNTGSYTAKGELLREMFSFNRYLFKFDYEVPVVIAILAVYAVVGFNLTVYFIEDTAVYGWFYGIYVVGTILPPLLPTVFTVSVGISDNRLAEKRIATVNSESILVAGKVTRAFFDKTGTLTKQGLDFRYGRSAKSWNNAALSEELSVAMATCHNLTLSQTGALVGNPVDVTMFKASGADFVDVKGSTVVIQTKSKEKLQVVRHFDFDQHRMTQSVIVKRDDGTCLGLVKGSGESIKKLCNASTLPGDFDEVLREHARAGVYQICVGMKRVDENTAKSVSRDEVESGLDFVGILNFANELRPESADVISQLADGEVKSVMVTGDSVSTGIRIAQECGIMSSKAEVRICTVSDNELVWSTEMGEKADTPFLDEVVSGEVQLAVSGEAFEILKAKESSDDSSLLEHIRVFGRCTPRDKVAVVEAFVSLGFVTLMCGDGGNDCGALKTAHVGVALSDAEASVVAPFTALDKNITSVLDVLKEGRCALASALASYKFIIMYGQIETINQIINAYFQITFTEWCWVFMDGIWTITLGFTLPLSRAAKKLSETRPTASILGPHTMSSVLGVLGINFIFTVIALSVLWHQDWFQCRKWDDNDVSNVLVIGDNYESQVLFLVTGYQYVASAFVFNFGYEFRTAWFMNYLFMALFVFYSLIMFYITMVPGELSCIWRVNCVNDDTVNGVTSREPFPIQNPFGTTVMPESFRWKILVIMIANLFALSLYEYFVVNGVRKYLASKKRQDARKSLAPEKEAAA